MRLTSWLDTVKGNLSRKRGGGGATATPTCEPLSNSSGSL